MAGYIEGVSQTRRRIVLSRKPKSTQHIYRSSYRGGFVNTYMTPEGKAQNGLPMGKRARNGKEAA
jgi:hypothetical protein